MNSEKRDHEVERRQQPHVAEVTDEHDRHDRLGRVDHRACGGASPALVSCGMTGCTCTTA